MEVYSRLLSSNVVPEPIEITTIQEGINSRTKTIDQLELEVRRLDAQRQRPGIEREWRKVRREHDKLATEREVLRGLLTAFRRLPVEILSEIFTVVHSDADCNPHWRPAQVVTLCRVSKLWRYVALSTPRLWNYLVFFRKELVRRCDIGKISRWMGRSGSTERRLELHNLDGCNDAHEDGSSHCPLIERWEVAKLLSEGPLLHALCLHNVFADCLQGLAIHMEAQQAGVSRPWDSLVSLTISLKTRWGREPPTFADTLLHLPSVRSFRLTGVPSRRGGRIRLPINNPMLKTLTTLEIRRLPTSSISSLSSLCSNLTELTMGLDWTDATFSASERPRCFPSIRILRLDEWSHTRVTLLPELFLTPALVELGVKFVLAPEDAQSSSSASDEDESNGESRATGRALYHRFELATGLTSFIRQSKAGVRRLRLDSLKISPRGMEQILVNIPSVTDLTLNRVHLDSTLFQPASHLAADHHLLLLPRLETLRLSSMENSSSFGDVCKFFAWRVTYPPKYEALKTVVLEVDSHTLRSYESTPADDLRKAVSKLRKVGVDVYVALLKFN